MANDPHGFEAFNGLLRQRQLGPAPAVFFDVGANVGQTVDAIGEHFGEVEVHAFEPAPAAFARLQARHGTRARTHLVNAAVGAAPGVLRMQARGASTANRVVDDPAAQDVVEVPAISGDAYIAERSIDRVGYLKIDAEGHDLEVLRGFQASLAAQRIDFVEVEAGVSVDNDRHVPMEALKAALEGQGYRIVQIKSVVSDQGFSGLAAIRRCNLVFASLSLLEGRRVDPAAWGKARRAAQQRKADKAARSAAA